MDAQLRELIPFLRDKNPQVRQVALSNLLPQTLKGAAYRDIFFTGLQAGGLQKSKESDIIRDLKLLCRDQLSVAHDAFRALVNLSDSPLLVAPLSEPSFLTFIVSYIINPQSILAELASMLLSNLTASSVACSTILTLNIPVILGANLTNSFYPVHSRCGTCDPPVPYPSEKSQDMFALPLLVDAFVQGAQLHESDDPSKRVRKGEINFLASVFANLTTAPAGRNFFLTPRPSNPLRSDSTLEYPLAKLTTFTEHKDTIRRGGVASTIKNCAFHASGHKAMLSPESARTVVPPSGTEAPGIDVLPSLLLPLAGPEEFDLDDQDKLPESLQFLPPTKTREPDPVIRLTHVESLLLLCHTRWGRDYQRAHGVYQIVRATHENETVDKISEHIERLVTLIQGDEPSENIDEGIDEVQSGASAPAPTTHSDDEDNIIEEI